jgi:hypothetical protein
MNIQHLITERFKHLMNCPWRDFPERKNRFELYINKLRHAIEAGNPFTFYSGLPYTPHTIAEYGYRIREYCADEMPDGAIEDLIIEELNKRGLVHRTVIENVEAVAIAPGTIRLYGGFITPIVLEEELLPSDEFLGHPIYKHKEKIFTIESVQREDAPVNNVGGGNIAGVSPGQEPPGKRGMYFARNLKKTKDLNKKLKRKL